MPFSMNTSFLFLNSAIKLSAKARTRRRRAPGSITLFCPNSSSPAKVPTSLLLACSSVSISEFFFPVKKFQVPLAQRFKTLQTLLRNRPRLRRHPKSQRNLNLRLSSKLAIWYCANFPDFTNFINSNAKLAWATASPPSPTNCFKCISGVRTLVEYPISIAVSRLSPVNTHSLIPAWDKEAMVSGTPCCNLSSIAVTPTICKPVSMSNAASFSF
mmetsp:Transcript_27965/g.34018  ORF Transcript_27965/g.34018 Transcript_27965/m.34018 type:complete len:214 (+) Transcript_27965:608-1249(+)